jgi:hypothetical protein
VYSAPISDLTTRESPSGDSSETRNFRQNGHLCERRAESSAEMHGNHIDRASAADITRTSTLSQQELVSGHIVTYLLKARTVEAEK